MKREKTAKILRAALFLLLLIFVLKNASFLLTPKTAERKYRRFFSEKAGFDVLFTGISLTMVGVYPMELYDEYGLTSFNMGESGCRPQAAYWALKMALDDCDPSLVVIDVRRMDLTEKTLPEYARHTLDAFPLSLTKCRAAFDLYEDFADRMSMIFPIVSYHYRWSELEKSDFRVNAYRLDNGARHYMGDDLRVAQVKTYPAVPADDARPPEEVSAAYLKKMIELCRSRGISVMLQELPCPLPEDDQRYANGVQAVADEYGVPYLNLYHEDMINYGTDFANAKHMNDSGARKSTHAIGAFIRDHFDIPDRRDDPSYSDWNGQLEKYMDFKKDRLKSQKKADVFLMLLRDARFDTGIRISANAGCLSDGRLMELVRNIAGEELPLLEEAIAGGEEYRAYIRGADGTAAESLRGDPVQLAPSDADWQKGSSAEPPAGEMDICVFDARTGEPVLEKSF